MRPTTTLVLLTTIALAQRAAGQHTVLEHVSSPPTKPLWTDSDFLVAGDQAYFVGNSGAGNEIHVTDGTATGARMLIDLRVGPGGGVRKLLGVMNNQGPWALATSVSSNEYWLTNGVRSETLRLRDLPKIEAVIGELEDGFLVTTDSGPHQSLHLLRLDGRLELLLADKWITGHHTVSGTHYVTTLRGLFATDGTAAGTSTVLATGTAVWHPEGNFWIWEAPTFHASLRKFDPLTGTLGPNVLPVNWGPPTPLHPVPGGIVTMRLTRQPNEFWASDGTIAGTRRFDTILDHSLVMGPYRDRTFLIGHDPVHDMRPWVTDGTDGGTHPFVDLGERRLIPWVFAAASDGVYLFAALPERRVRVLFVDERTRTVRELGDLPSLPKFAVLQDRLITSYGSFDPRRPRPFLPFSRQSAWPKPLELSRPIVRGGQLIIGSQPSAATIVTSGSRESTRVIAAAPRLHSSHYAHLRPRRPQLAAVGDRVYIPSLHTDGTVWREWDSATQAIGAPWPQQRTPVRAVCEIANGLAFVEDELVIRRGQNTTRHPLPPLTDWGRAELVAADDSLYAVFYATGGFYRFHLRKESWDQVDHNIHGILDVVDDRVLCLRNDHLFVSDGSRAVALNLRVEPAGIEVFKWNGSDWLLSGGGLTRCDFQNRRVVRTQPTNSWIWSVAPLPDAIYASVWEPEHGGELWRFDGTSWTRVTDLVAGPFNSVFSVTAIGDRLLLAAGDGETGIEPWISDGTAAGTRQLADLMPGVNSSNPEFIAIAGEYAYFSALTPGAAELLALPLADLGIAHTETVGAGCSSSSGSSGVPALSVTAYPRIAAERFGFAVTGATAVAPAALLLDTEISLFALGTCRVRSLGTLTTSFVATSKNGDADWRLPLPSDPSLVGQTIAAQVLVVDASAPSPGAAVSNALLLVVGAER